MTPIQAARAVAEDLDLIGTQDTAWLAQWWYRYAHYLSTPELTSNTRGCCDSTIDSYHRDACPLSGVLRARDFGQPDHGTADDERTL